MRKTLALLLAAGFLYLVPSHPVSVKSQSLAATSKFQTVANPIPDRYIVVLATTDLSPIATPAPTPVQAAPKGAQASSASSQASVAAVILPDLIGQQFVASPIPDDPVVVATATNLTATYGGTFSITWSNALKGFRLNSTEAEAIAMSGDSRVAFIVQDGAIAVGTPDGEPIVMVPDENIEFRHPQPNASWGLEGIDQRYLPLDTNYEYQNNGQGVNVYVIDTGILPTHWEFSDRAFAIYDAVNREGTGNTIGIDCNGHGSHVAGTIGGRTFGVAKRVRLFGVRV